VRTEGLGGLQVDDQLELRGLLDGEVGGLGSLQDLVDIDERRVAAMFHRIAVQPSIALRRYAKGANTNIVGNAGCRAVKIDRDAR
jgi:hypothetical protein